MIGRNTRRSVKKEREKSGKVKVHAGVKNAEERWVRNGRKTKKKKICGGGGPTPSA